MTPHMTTGAKATRRREDGPLRLHTPGGATLITGQVATQLCSTCAVSLVHVTDQLELIAGVEAFRQDRYVVITDDGAAYATREQVRDGERCTP